MLESPGPAAPADRPGDTPLLRLSRSRLAPFLATAMFVWLGFLVLSPLAYNQPQVFKPKLVGQPLWLLPGTLGAQGLVGIVTAAYLAHLAFHRRLPGRTVLDWAVAGLIGAYALAVALSIYPRFSLEATFLLSWVILTFYVFHDIDELTPALMVRGLAGVGIAGAIYALYKVGSDYFDWLDLQSAVQGGWLVPPSVPRVHGVGDHVNMIALAFNLTLPFALVVALEARHRLERVIGRLGAAAIVLALFFTVSRAAWVSAAIALPLFLLLYRWRDTGAPRLPAPRVSRRTLLAGAVLAALVLAGGGALAASRWESRPEWLFRSSLAPRYDAFHVALDIVRDEPWTGSGPNTYSILYNVYSGDYPIENFHPHNGYLATLVDTGLVGAIAVAVLGLVLVRSLVSTYATGSPRSRVWAAACLSALTALMVHSGADMPNQSKTALLLLALIAALAVKIGARPSALVANFSPRNLPRVLVLAFVPLLVGAWLWTDRGQSSYDKSLEFLLKGDFDASTQQALQAAGRDPNFAAYQFHAGAMQAIDYLIRRDRGEAPSGLLEGAEASLRHGLKSEPHSAIGHLNLAIVLRMEGDIAAAVQEAGTAMVRAPGDGTIAAVAGTIFEWASRDGDAIYAYSLAVTHDAGLIDSPFWETSQFRKDVRGVVVDGTFLSACQKARVVALYRGYPDDLQALADRCSKEVALSGDPRARSDLAIALASLGQADQAEKQARLAVERAPDNAYARTALAIARAHDGDIEEVRRQLTIATELKDPDAALLLYYTYSTPPTTLRNNLHLPSSGEEAPDSVKDRLEAALPLSAPFVYDNGIQRYLLGILYYRPRYFRESPASILIPDDWIAFASPRTLLIQQALKDAGRR